MSALVPKVPQQTVWCDFPTPQASSDRGWFKAITAPWSTTGWMVYNSDNMPVWDDEITAWREQSTLGSYVDYVSSRVGRPPILAMCHGSRQSAYVSTVPEAKAWIEKECLRIRPELIINASLF